MERLRTRFLKQPVYASLVPTPRGERAAVQRKIEQALERIDDGTYGYCEDTGEPIGVLRLKARPIATLTIDAQERREMKERVLADR